MLMIAATIVGRVARPQAQKQQFDLSTITCKQFFEYRQGQPVDAC